MEEELDECLKELMFHPCFQKMGEWKEMFRQVPLETILYRIRDHVTSEELRVIIGTLNQIGDWIKE